MRKCLPVACGLATVPFTGMPLLSKNTLAPALNLEVALAERSIALGRLAPDKEAEGGMSASFWDCDILLGPPISPFRNPKNVSAITSPIKLGLSVAVWLWYEKRRTQVGMLT